MVLGSRFFDGVECFREVYRHRHCSVERTLLVETRDHLLGQREENSCGGASIPETMFGVGKGKV